MGRREARGVVCIGGLHGGRYSRRPGAAHDASPHTLSSCMRRVCVGKDFPHAGASNEAVGRFRFWPVFGQRFSGGGLRTTVTI